MLLNKIEDTNIFLTLTFISTQSILSFHQMGVHLYLFKIFRKKMEKQREIKIKKKQ